jgi:hypothetical protein
MRMPFGKYKDQELNCIPKDYLSWVYGEYKPIVIAIERFLKILPRERRSEKVELEMLFNEHQSRYPDNRGMNQLYDFIVDKFYS